MGFTEQINSEVAVGCSMHVGMANDTVSGLTLCKLNEIVKGDSSDCMILALSGAFRLSMFCALKSCNK